MCPLFISDFYQTLETDKTFKQNFSISNFMETRIEVLKLLHANRRTNIHFCNNRREYTKLRLESINFGVTWSRFRIKHSGQPWHHILVNVSLFLRVISLLMPTLIHLALSWSGMHSSALIGVLVYFHLFLCLLIYLAYLDCIWLRIKYYVHKFTNICVFKLGVRGPEAVKHSSAPHQ
jgi:hypothetical protein